MKTINCRNIFMSKKLLPLLLSATLATSAIAADDAAKVSAWTQFLSIFTNMMSSKPAPQQYPQQYPQQGNQQVPSKIYVVPQNNQAQIVPYNAAPPTVYVVPNNMPTEPSGVTSLFGNSRPADKTDITKNYTPGTNPGYKWPVAETNGLAKNTVVSPWGPRCHIHPDGTEFCGDDATMHNGIDLNVPTGTPVSSMNGGKVAWVDPYCSNRKLDAPPQGCSVSVVNDKGEMFTYMHLSNTPLKTGDSINAGGSIGESGNTGKSTGAHLHIAACEIKPEKVTGTSYPMSLCKPENGGKAVNPLDKLDPTDPRSISGRKLEKLRDEYHKCLKESRAVKDTKRAAECKKAYQQRKAMPKSEPTTVDTRQSKSAVF